MNKSRSISALLSSDMGILISLALVRVLLQSLTNGNYGFHQDELVTLDAAKHLAWGYVAWPPITPFLARVSLTLFGPSLIGLRLFAAVAEGIVMLLVGLMIRELGGSRWAQILGAVVVGTTPNSIVQGGLFQYETFDYLCWVLLAFMVVRLLRSENPRGWLGIGAVIGIGLMTKYTIAFSVAGVIVGTLATRNRRYLTSPWLWGGALLALVMWLPNLIWQFQNRWVSLYFLASIHTRDIQAGLTSTFLTDQFLFNLNPVMLLLVIAGLYFFSIARAGQTYRLMAWMYAVPLVLFFLTQGKGYYLAAAYPMLAAGGAAWWEKRLSGMANPRWASAGRWATWIVMGAFAAFLIATLLPVAPLGSGWWNVVSRGNVELKSEIGWPELVQQVATVYHSLPDSEKGHAAILAASSGEVGSLALYGPTYGLPRPISGFNSFWQYGYGDPPPQTVIVVGFPTDLLSNFQDCTLIAPITMPFNIQNEETINHRSIYVCHALREPWPDFWAHFQYFG